MNSLYDAADILATSKYLPEKTQTEPSYADKTISPKNKAHKDVKYWYKFQNEIVFDGVPYTVTFNIRDKGKEQYQYLIDFKENKTLGLSNTVFKKSENLLRADQASNTIIRNSAEKSTGKFSLSPIAPEIAPDGNFKITSEDVTLKTPEVQRKAESDLGDIPIRDDIKKLSPEDIAPPIEGEKNEETTHILANMSDAERSKILKSKKLENVPSVDSFPQRVVESISNDETIENISSWEDINNYFGSKKRTLIQKIASEFGVFKDYNNADINIEFEFSNNNFRESYSKQGKNYEHFAKMFSVFDKVVENAIGIEVHNRNAKGYKKDKTLNNVYVMISSFADNNYIHPVKLEVKEFKDKPNKLYVAIALDGIKKTEVWKQGTTENGVAQNSRSVNISIADLMKKVNPKNTNFTKYFPEVFLTNEQKMVLEAEQKSKKTTTRQELHNSIVEDIKTKFSDEGYDFDEVLSKAKDLSTFKTVDNTPQRVMEKSLGYKEGQLLADATVNKVAQNETEGIKWLNNYIAQIKAISKQYNIKPGSKESAGAQMYAEGFYVDKNNNIVEYGDSELTLDFPDAKVRENIKALARDPQTSIVALAQKNIEKTLEIYDSVVSLLSSPLTFDELLKGVFDKYSLTLSMGQYSLVGSTLRSYISYLWDEGRIEPEINDNLMKWKKTE